VYRFGRFQLQSIWGLVSEVFFSPSLQYFHRGASLIESHEKQRKAQIHSDGTNRGRAAASLDSAGAKKKYSDMIPIHPRECSFAAIGILSRR
jgi:hypothetical protein